MNISVIGTGYVGLVTGTCLADLGNNVLCVDIDSDKVLRMANGEIPIYEPFLEEIFKKNIDSERLSFTTELSHGIEHGKVIFLALPTPEDEDGSADLSHVLNVTEGIARMAKTSKILVGKSTVPVGTASKMDDLIKGITDIKFDIVSNPEFLREGYAVNDFMKPERIIVGSDSKNAIETIRRIYKPFIKNGSPFIVMNQRSAELTKYASNAFLATKITFMNEIANFCERVGADVEKVRIGMGADSRIGKKFLFPGMGFGGSCFPKDVKALHVSSRGVKYDFKILEAVIKVNEDQKKILLPKLLEAFDQDLKNKKLAIWGLSFKPETDDIREASSLALIKELLFYEAEVVAFDPAAARNVRKVLGDQITYAKDIYEAAEDADALMICTEWGIFKSPDFKRLKKLLKCPRIFDGRNIYDPQEMENEGFEYWSVGRG